VRPSTSSSRRSPHLGAAVLRAGGKLVVLEFFRPQTLWSRTFHAAYNHTVLPVVGWASTGHLDAYLYLPRSIASFDTAERYMARLHAAGFGDVRVRALTFGVASVVEATRIAAEPR
jgi:ubiquinone/menaquinone biosynthesis C-methylase UbiE